jgi:drug/metabolite transporter (DMT)-like permease
MIHLPKPRGFWDYALFALIMAGILFLFWVEASDGIGWADAALALSAAALFVFGTILARRGEKATWVAWPTWHAHLLATAGAFALQIGMLFLNNTQMELRNV